MFVFIQNIRDVDFNQFVCVYQESIDRIGSQQPIYDDLYDFFQCRGAFLAVWENEGNYLCCVRGELSGDGILLSCLETAPEKRRRGYATLMLRSLILELRGNFSGAIYVHVANKNKASFALHSKLGFQPCLDYARLVDGTISRSYCTMKYE